MTMTRPILAALLAFVLAPAPYAVAPMPPAYPVAPVQPRTSLPSWVPQPPPPTDPSLRIPMPADTPAPPPACVFNCGRR